MKYWIWLTQLKGIGPLMSRKLFSEFGNPENIYNADYEQLIKVPGIGALTAKAILNNKSLESAKIIHYNCHKGGIGIINCNEKDYGRIYNNHPEMPILLYYKGKIKYVPGIAVVGSRRCSFYGKKVVADVSEYLAKNNITVISGMAKGIDGYAHTACLNSGGYTIAFVGNGLDICYPKEHFSLMESIIENGAVFSEYPPGTKVRPEHFPRRNYLISSWSEKILVVEASKNSGALITASIAKAQGKKILAVPSEIHSITGEGTNQLIFDGAEIYLKPDQLLTNCNDITAKPNELKISDIHKTSLEDTIFTHRKHNELEQKVLYCVSYEAKTIDEIAKSIDRRPFEFIELITILELEGKIKGLPGGRYTIT